MAMLYVYTAISVLGIVVFATLLWNSRARMAGLVGYCLTLFYFLYLGLRPDVANVGPGWEVYARWLIILQVAGDVLLLGAVYALRPNPSTDRASMEAKLARPAAILAMIALALGAVLRDRVFAAPMYAGAFAGAVIALMAMYAMLIRWGTRPAGIVGAAGFGLTAVLAIESAVGLYFPAGPQGFVPQIVIQVLGALGQAAIVGGFALAAREPGIERAPYLGAASNGMTTARWVGLALTLIGCALFVLIAYAIGEAHVLQGLRGRAALLGPILPAAGLYVAMIGGARLTTGRPVWTFA
jgi:hypothetical protein